MKRDLVVDGENRAVRSFLACYGCTPGITVKQMRDHLEASGYSYWPEWVDAQSNWPIHLTKNGAQGWLRYLFDMEKQ